MVALLSLYLFLKTIYYKFTITSNSATQMAVCWEFVHGETDSRGQKIISIPGPYLKLLGEQGREYTTNNDKKLF
jgi:hypothetical protein